MSRDPNGVFVQEDHPPLQRGLLTPTGRFLRPNIHCPGREYIMITILDEATLSLVRNNIEISGKKYAMREKKYK